MGNVKPLISEQENISKIKEGDLFDVERYVKPHENGEPIGGSKSEAIKVDGNYRIKVLNVRKGVYGPIVAANIRGPKSKYKDPVDLGDDMFVDYELSKQDEKDINSGLYKNEEIPLEVSDRINKVKNYLKTYKVGDNIDESLVSYIYYNPSIPSKTDGIHSYDYKQICNDFIPGGAPFGCFTLSGAYGRTFDYFKIVEKS